MSVSRLCTRSSWGHCSWPASSPPCAPISHQAHLPDPLLTGEIPQCRRTPGEEGASSPCLQLGGLDIGVACGGGATSRFAGESIRHVTQPLSMRGTRTFNVSARGANAGLPGLSCFFSLAGSGVLSQRRHLIE